MRVSGASETEPDRASPSTSICATVMEGREPSRRGFLKSGAGLLAGIAGVDSFGW